MASAFDEPLDPALLARLRARFAPIGLPRGGVDAIERAWGVPAPRAYRELLDALGGGTLIGAGALELASSHDLLPLIREDYRAFRSTEGARVAFFGTDGGGHEYFFDVDDWFGEGAYAVLAADGASDLVERCAPSFAAFLVRMLDGPRRGDADVIARPRPPGSERR